MKPVVAAALTLAVSAALAAPVRSIRSGAFQSQTPSGPPWDPLAEQGQWFRAPDTGVEVVKAWEFHDDDDALSIQGIVQDIIFDGTGASNIVYFTVLATVSNNLPSVLSPPEDATNSHNEQQAARPSAYAETMLGARITAEFAIADITMIPDISGTPPYYTDPVSPTLGARYFIEAINEHERAWYCWAPGHPGPGGPGEFQIPAWVLGDIAPGATASVLMAFQITNDDGTPGVMTRQDYRHSVIRYSQEQQADLLYNRHTSLKISHWLDTLLIDYDAIITAPAGDYEEEPPEYIYASDASVFFDPELDFGDAPDAPYPTLMIRDGARHVRVPGVHLGSLIDVEPDGRPDPDALGDDNHNLSDEDGVTLVDGLVRGSQATFTVEASTIGFLNAWIDFHRSGSWSDPLDQIATDQPLSPGPNVLHVSVPADASLGITYGRFRFSSDPGLQPTGLADDGEVEDYAFVIYQTGPSEDIEITNIAYDAGTDTVTIEWNGETPVVYETQYTDLLNNATWTSWGGSVDAAPYAQSQPLSTQTSRFYRVVAPYTEP